MHSNHSRLPVAHYTDGHIQRQHYYNGESIEDLQSAPKPLENHPKHHENHPKNHENPPNAYYFNEKHH